jgi:hypothetical protein
LSLYKPINTYDLSIFGYLKVKVVILTKYFVSANSLLPGVDKCYEQDFESPPSSRKAQLQEVDKRFKQNTKIERVGSGRKYRKFFWIVFFIITRVHKVLVTIQT